MYEKHTWECGETVTAALLNHMEDGIADSGLKFVKDASDDRHNVVACDVENNTASSHYALASGYQTTASGNVSDAEGSHTTASGDVSHAEGFDTTASGYVSHAEGYGTVANHRVQKVFGQFNEIDTNHSARDQKGDYIEIVGNGNGDEARSNARTLDWNGNESLQGSLTLGKGTADETTITASQLKQLLTIQNGTNIQY